MTPPIVPFKTKNSLLNIKNSGNENIALYEKGKIVDYCANFAKIFGYEDSDISGMSLFHFFPKIFRELAGIEPVPGNEHRFETLAVRKDSSTFPVDILVKTLERDGELVLSLAIRNNIDRKELEYKLEKTTSLQKAILDSSSFAIIATDFNGTIKTFNKGAEKIFRFKEEDVVDIIRITDLCLESEIKERALLLSAQLNKKVKPGFGVLVENLQSQSSYESEWTCVRSDSSQLTALITVTPLKDHLDEVTGYLFIANDVSDKKKAEAEIVDKSQLLNGILSNMPVFVFKVGHKGLFKQTMGAGLQHLNFKDNQLVGYSIYDVFPAHKPAIEKAYRGEFVSFINTTTIPDKQLHYEYFLFPDLSNRGALIGFAQDITEKINSELKLKDSALTLTKTNDELNQFAHIVSHDLKAPLRAISSLSEWIEDGLKDAADPEIMRNLSMLRSRVRKMQNLIDGILNYSKVGQIKSTPEEVDTFELVTDVIQTIDVPAKFNIQIEKLPAILFNSILLEQLFSNLISNAIKYHNKPHGEIVVSYHEEENYHLFSVSDNGPGIPPEGKEKIFQIFQTLQSKEKEESTGVGLAIVKKIAEDHGGSVWVESDGRSGSTFTFKLPKNPIKNNG